MADSVTVEMKGVEELMSSIKQLAIASPMAVQKGTLRVAGKIQRQAMANVPVQYGRLRASLTFNWTGSGIGRAVPERPATKPENPTRPDDGVGQPQQKPDTFVAVIGSNVEYAPAVEFNETANHPKGGGPHYLYGAYFSYENEVPSEISAELGKELAKAMKK